MGASRRHRPTEFFVAVKGENAMKEERLSTYLKDRPAELEEAKRKGVKIIGYFPGNYVPEELIYASGAVPICLAYGANRRAVDAALSVVPNIICPFARGQIGERILKTNPYYGMVDMLVAPITCQHLKKVAEVWEYHGDMEIFKLGVPHKYDGDSELDYYADRLRALRDRLQAYTGNEVTDERIGEAIRLYNRMRELLKKISLLRRATDLPLSALDFIKLNHASFCADPAFMVDVLESVYRELTKKQDIPKVDSPRLLLLGPNVSLGDYEILELVEASGGRIVIEELCEGVRYYWHNIEKNADVIQSLAEGYLVDKLPCAFMRNSTRKRLDFALQLAMDFDVSGAIWYELLCCEVYDAESYLFAQKMAERHIPMLVLESDYGPTNVGQFKVRIEAFVEMIEKGTEQ
jgi:benzoyl-CoA reductase/2-hydroxyglutaryl-CoA dehydratase subunit BcrC/BadD/HgdB